MSRVVTRIGGVSAATGLMTLLAATPAFAVDPYFKIHFVSGPTSSSNTPGGLPGIQGVATYTFSETVLGQMVLNLENTSTAGTSKLAGTGFDLPGPTSTPPSPTTITVGSAQAIPTWGINNGDTLPPFGQFDVCVTTNNPGPPPAFTALGGCDAGGVDPGLSNGQNDNVATFQFNSSPSLLTATAYRDSFANLFTTAPDNSFFMRFKEVNIGTVTGGSDKILATSLEKGGGTPPPPQGPGDSVPGPLPLFGAAAAFGYSRKLRRRMKVQNVIG